MAKEKNWFDNVDQKSVEKGIEILPNFDLPNVNEEPKEFLILGEPYVIDIPDGEFGNTMVKMKVEHNDMVGEITLSDNLKRNIAICLGQMDKDYKTANISGMYILIKKETNNKNKQQFYSCMLRNA